MIEQGQVQGRGILSGVSNGNKKIRHKRTHSAEYACNLQHKIELGSTRNLARSFCCLQSFGSQLREQQGQARIVVMWVANLRH